MAPKRASKNAEKTFRKNVQKDLEMFSAHDEMETMEFPPSVTSAQRDYIKKISEGYGLKAKTHGAGCDQSLLIYKPHMNDALLTISPDSLNLIKGFLLQNDEANKKPPAPSSASASEPERNKRPKNFNFGFAIFKMCVPPLVSISYDMIAIQMQLPITGYREAIVDMINRNQVVVIAGDAGSGKTTQVPQYILGDHTMRGTPCRIICTQPERIAAVSMADRIAFERNEVVGDAVGYQIRLESRISPGSNLVCTTSDFLLRCVISNASSNWLNRITHIILDEVHEHDKYTDVLLIAFKEILAKNSKLKIILMSATTNPSIFTNYFRCPSLNIPVRTLPVAVYHLEDVLGMMGRGEKQIKIDHPRTVQHQFLPKPCASRMPPSQRDALYKKTLKEWFYGRCDFDELLFLIASDGADVNVKGADIELTALMIAAISDKPHAIELLLQFGADPKISDASGCKAVEWASRFGHFKCVEMLRNAEMSGMDDEAQETSDMEIDHDVVFDAIKFVHREMNEGSILVFLPGFDDIVEQMQKICHSDIGDNIEVLLLHGNMEVTDQKRIFQPAESGVRKIILSTNIAEKSITIEDVVHVIDSGKVKQITYNPVSGSTNMTSMWISKACAKQRVGRAGRTKPGFCYRLYSGQRFHRMDEFTLPELMCIPLTEMCLHASIMTETTITDYLSKAVQPPPITTVEEGIGLLKTIGGLDADEKITELGYRLVDFLSVDARLGKMLIWGVLLKCLDPVLTIASFLSIKCPFIINFELECPSNLVSETFCDNSYSDLTVFIQLYQLWMQNKANNQEIEFCRNHRVSNGIMELIHSQRMQILGQVRTIGLITPRGAGDMTDLNRNSNNFPIVKACFLAGFYPNVCRVDQKEAKMKSKQEKALLPHSVSVLREKELTSLPSEWIVYEDMTRADGLRLVRNNTVVNSLTVALFGGPLYKSYGTVKFIVDGWTHFVCDEDVTELICELRAKIEDLFMKKFRSGEYRSDRHTTNGDFTDIIAKVLAAEDAFAGFPKCSTNVGARPFPLPTNKRSRNASRTASHHHDEKATNRHSFGRNLPSEHRTIVLYSENGCSRSLCEADEFDAFVANFKKQVMLKPWPRYFVVHAISKDTILELFKIPMQWPFSLEQYKYFWKIKQVIQNADIVMYFLIPNRTFYCMGRLNQEGNHLQVECFSAREVSLVEARTLTGAISDPIYGERHLDEFNNCEEILDSDLAEKMFRSYIRKQF